MVNKMRILTSIPAIAILILISCDEKQKSKEHITPENIVETTKTKIKAADPAKTIATGIGGTWINKKYAEKLFATKSPKKSQDVSPITMLVLPTEINEKASIIWGFHEGTSGKLIEEKGIFKIQSEESDEPELKFKLEGGKIKSQKDEFIKIKANGSKKAYNVVEQLLFSGKYDLDGKQIEFKNDGKVTGLDSFSYYSVLIDYYDAGMQVDQIRLGKSMENSKLYGFEFRNDKLSIYELKCTKFAGDYCEVVKNGKRLYKLVRK